MKVLPRGVLPFATVITGFFVVSALASRPDEFDAFARPVYARWDPGFAPLGLLPIGAGAFMALLARRALRGGVRRPSGFLAVAMLGMLAFAGATAAIDGSHEAVVTPFTEGIDYPSDVPLVHELGVRAFVEDYPEVLPRAGSPHTRTHPPGPVLLAVLLEQLFPTSVGARAAVLAIASVMVLLPAWWLARMFAGSRAAVTSVLLLAVAPSIVLHTLTSFDAAIATGLVVALALLVRGLGPTGDERWALAGGVATGIMSFFTFAVGFVAVFGGLYALTSRRTSEATRLLAAAAAGGIVALVALRVGLGFDLFASYRASHDVLTSIRLPSRSYWYWLFGNPIVWLASAGILTGALALRELLRRRPPVLVAMVVPLAVFYVLPASLTGIIPGETERTLLWVYPLATTAAAAAWLREEHDHSGARAWILVAIAAAQTIVMEALYETYW